MELFNDTNGEHLGVFSKIEPLLGQLRTVLSPQAFVNLEKLIDNTPGGREKVAAFRQRMLAVRAQMKAQQDAAAKTA
jgi:hypothetical protein